MNQIETNNFLKGGCPQGTCFDCAMRRATNFEEKRVKLQSPTPSIIRKDYQTLQGKSLAQPKS